MMYDLTIRAKHNIQGRKAEALCRTIGITEIVPSLWFDMGCSNKLPEHEIDRIVPSDRTSSILTLQASELDLLTPGDYTITERSSHSLKIGSVWDTPRMIALYDRVMQRRHEFSDTILSFPSHGCGDFIGVTHIEPDDMLLVGTEGIVRLGKNGTPVKEVLRYVRHSTRSR